MARKKKHFHFYLDRWLQSMKTGTKVTLKSLQKFVPQLSAIGHVTKKLKNWGNRHANIHRHPLFKIYDSHLMRSQFWGMKILIWLLTRRKAMRISISTSYISLNIRICWTCNLNCTQLMCCSCGCFVNERWKWWNVMVININHMLSSEAQSMRILSIGMRNLLAMSNLDTKKLFRLKI